MDCERTVTVIVPVYNGAETVRGCIESLLSQEYPADRFQIIVVDNDSDDDTARIVQQYPVTLLHERDRQSSYAARNRGLQHATGEIVAFTDADCLPERDWVSYLAAAFAAPEVAGAGGHIQDAAPGNDVERFVAEVQPLRNFQRLGEGHHLSLVTANAAYRRTTLEAVDGFDERMQTGGDLDLSWRVQQQGLGEIVYVPQAIVQHRHRNTQKGMYDQFRRYGYCSATMTALHAEDQTYPQTARWQRRQVLKQVRALFTYLASLLYRNTAGLVTGRPRYERIKPFYWLVVESAALHGRLNGMWETRCFRQMPRVFREPGP